MKPTILFDPWTPEAETRMLLFIASQIGVGFYQNYGFIFSVGQLKKPEVHSLILTEKLYWYLKDEFEWGTLNPEAVAQSWPVLNSAAYIPSYRQVVDYQVSPNDRIASEIAALEDDFFSFLHVFSPLASIITIRVSWMKIGTISSFNMQKDTNTLYIYLREDALLVNFLYCLINGVLEIDDGNIHKWRVRQEMMRRIFNIPTLKAKYPDADLIIDHLEKHEHNLEKRRKSDQYFASLGYPCTVSLDTRGDRFYIAGEEEVKDLSKSEHTLLSFLVAHAGEVVPYDFLAQAVWGEGFYSLEALTKIVERIRRKLKNAGARKSMIHTVRGRGYQLVR